MNRAPQPRRWQRWLALALAVLGAALLVWTLWGFLRVTISEQAPGPTAGGAATLVERCSRGVPAELVPACVAQAQHRSQAERQPLAVAAILGGVLLALALGVASTARHRLKNQTRRG